ncbi:MAG: Smr/MutS family endonuclease [Sedimenticola sp.]|nr:Smr/MutS family endonuclease [Sedimenticola sp.]MCW8883098.1 Smr/MutS family endonuclease [Sedimenticola sp.]MCW8945876.1 Smr/MutS family endonuclease [Sedimenticola sp.]MCW8950292.1 Smr/MutS family endonuclease [Sedimenticola sp.]MCW8975975.1 Smr/MutS family endonuclease [Sedimenticola sp.]
MNSDKQDNEILFNELIQQEMDDAIRHEHDKTLPYKPKLKPLPLPPNPKATGDEFSEDFMDLNLETGEELEFHRPGVQNRLFQELRRGKMPPESMLDLHGLRVIEARKALASFLAHAIRHRLRVVQIIHGKGSRSEDQQPILKQKINQWLRQRDEVLAFCSAPRFDGGTGAAYVLLSRKGFKEDNWR